MVSLLAGFIAAVVLFLEPAAVRAMPHRSYIVQCNVKNDFQSLESAIGPYGRITRRIELLPFYHAASITFNDSATSLYIDKKVAELARDIVAFPAVAPLHKVNLYSKPWHHPTRLDPIVLGKLLAQGLPGPFPPHAMTQIDKLHEQNTTGRGIKVAIISSGINHRDTFFGNACLGPGCLVENYFNYVPDTCAPTPDDVSDCHSAGTLIASSIAAQLRTDEPNNIVGASPGVKLAVYRVTGSIDASIVMDAIVRALRDGAAIIVVPFSIYGGVDAGHPLARLVAAIAAARDDVAIIFNPGGYTQHRPFDAKGWLNVPSSGGAAITAGWLQSTHETQLGFHSYYAAFRAQLQPLPEVLKTFNSNDIGYSMTKQGDGAPVHYRSSWGPPIDMAVRPQFALPAEQIPTLFPNGVDFDDLHGYLVSSLLASIYALLGELNGGRVDPALFEAVLSTTAAPQPYSRNEPNGLAPVPMQGAGLVQARDAAYAAFNGSTTVSPISLSFNDTESAPSFLTLTITNRGSNTSSLDITTNTAAEDEDDGSKVSLGEVEYKINYHPAQTLYTAPERYIYAFSRPEIWNTSAELSFSQKSVKLARGESKEIHISSVVPASMDCSRLPLWSGHITIHGSDGTLLRVPYQGVASRLRDVVVVGARDADISDYGLLKDPDQWSIPCIHRGSDRKCPMLVLTVRMTTPLVRLYMVPMPLAASQNVSVSTTVPSPVGADHLLPELEIAGSPLTWLSPGEHGLSRWQGRFRNGSLAAPGTYVFAVKALRLRGDAGNDKDYNVAISRVFTIENSEKAE